MQIELPFKLVVTGTGADGVSRILADDRVRATVFGDGSSGQPWVSDLWTLERMPPGVEAAVPAGRGYALEPPVGGAVFRIAQIPPDPQPADGKRTKVRFDMHTTATVDCLVIVSGRIRLLLDEGEVELGPGDFVVQQATRHAWWNPGPDPCVMCALMASTRSAGDSGAALHGTGEDHDGPRE
jgi:mannose-6-phosphate isomerase-like protein (cupin superfamily)